jgi:hypothetical protein
MPTSIDHQKIEMGGSAVPGWALPAVSHTSPFVELMLQFIQFSGLLGVIFGIYQAVQYFNPNATRPPPNLGKPAFMFLVGLMALVPQRVLDLFTTTAAQMGWM